MPQMGGRELADRLRAGRSETKVLYVSGYTDDAILRQGVSETGTAFLPKPFTAADLAHKVRAGPRRGADRRRPLRPPAPRALARPRGAPTLERAQSARTAMADSKARIVSATSASSWTMDR